ncbi:hypothetical protein EMCRGX_G005879 [Ephydatia muelleri]
MAKKLGDSQPGFSDISGLGTKSLKSLIQSAVEKALEAERARTVSAGLTSSGEYTVEMSPKMFWDDEPRLSRRYLRELRTVGIYTGDEDPTDQDLFVVEQKAFKGLCSGLVQQCGCLSNPSWTLASFIKKGHVARVQFVCPHCKQSRVWASSRVLSGHYIANQKLVHAFTCAGILPRQYINFCSFAGMGEVKQRYIHSVYVDRLYQQVIADAAEESMKAAVDCVKARPHYATSGECRDTFWVESFNHQLLTYLPKRIHFHTKTFEMRMNLAVMDWNENTQRVATSHHDYTDVRRPDHRSTYNVLVKKTYRFVKNIWTMYILKNMSSQQILQEDDGDDDMVLPSDDTAMNDGDYVDSDEDLDEDDCVFSEDDEEEGNYS